MGSSKLFALDVRMMIAAASVHTELRMIQREMPCIN